MVAAPTCHGCGVIRAVGARSAHRRGRRTPAVGTSSSPCAMRWANSATTAAVAASAPRFDWTPYHFTASKSAMVSTLSDGSLSCSTAMATYPPPTATAVSGSEYCRISADEDFQHIHLRRVRQCLCTRGASIPLRSRTSTQAAAVVPCWRLMKPGQNCRR
jgi:hypothetical protein